LFEPIPNATLVWLRVAIGLLGGGDILGNGIYYHWYKQEFDGFTFRYYAFEWVHPLPEPFFSLFFIVGFLLGLAVAVGWRFRLTAPLFALCFTYVFLLEKAHYLNHAYLFCWLAWLLAFTPAWREWSLDVYKNPPLWSPVAPRWSVVLFASMMGIVYFFGGIAKLNADWLLHASPLHMWIKSRSDTPIIGPLLALKPTAYFMAWGGFLLDTFIVLFLLHKRLRWWALAAAVFFHATNHIIFQIGIFPYLSLVLTSLFFEPDWPKKFVQWLGSYFRFVKKWQVAWQERVRTSAGARLEASSQTGEISYSGHSPFRGTTTNADAFVIANAITKKWLVPSLVVLFSIHISLPLRHHLFASNVAWSEEGHRYSWRMMLRSKRGYGSFRVVNQTTGETSVIRPGEYLNRKQARKLYTHPDMILQYAHHLADECEREGNTCAVYADIQVRLNNGKYGPYIDPEVDLSQIEWSWVTTKPWVLKEKD
ncbi:MAG: HTTM domain-containing protein, partial [Bacteroidota bacterium]